MKNTDKELLKKFLEGRCTEMELQRVAWLLSQPQGQDMLDNLMEDHSAEEWNNQAVEANLSEEYISDRNLDIQRRIAAIEKKQQPDKNDRPVMRLKFLRYAAIWAGIFITASVAFWQVKKSMTQSSQIAYIDKTNTQHIPVKYMLPDGSQVFLGAGSKLHYPDNFKGDIREIRLEGEAFFDVKHMDTKPFIIHTGEIQTQVLGTSFKVEAFSSRAVMVAVATGKVGVSRNIEQVSKILVMLTPGLKATWNRATGNTQLEKIDIQSLLDWKAGQLEFDEPMELAAQKIQRRFGITISFADKDIMRNRVIGTFGTKETVSEVLDVLAFVGKFRYENKGNNKNYIIYKTN